MEIKHIEKNIIIMRAMVGKVGKNKMKSWKAAVRNWELMNKSKGQIESKVMQRLSTHEKAKQILKNIQDGN